MWFKLNCCIIIIGILSGTESVETNTMMSSLQGLEDEVENIYEMLPNISQSDITASLIKALEHSLNVVSLIPAIKTRCVYCFGIVPAVLLQTIKNNNETELEPLRQFQTKMKMELIARRHKVEAELTTLPNIQSAIEFGRDALFHFETLREAFEDFMMNPDLDSKQQLIEECGRGHHLHIFIAINYLLDQKDMLNARFAENNFAFDDFDNFATSIGFIVHGTEVVCNNFGKKWDLGAELFSSTMNSILHNSYFKYSNDSIIFSMVRYLLDEDYRLFINETKIEVISEEVDFSANITTENYHIFKCLENSFSELYLMRANGLTSIYKTEKKAQIESIRNEFRTVPFNKPYNKDQFEASTARARALLKEQFCHFHLIMTNEQNKGLEELKWDAAGQFVLFQYDLLDANNQTLNVRSWC